MKLLFTRLFLKKFYLRKLYNGQMNISDVAGTFMTSNDNVEIALNAYKASRNPFQRHDVSKIIRRIELLVTILSLLLVFFTLQEMQNARNAAYRPDIYISDSGFLVIWNSEGKLVDDYPDHLPNFYTNYDSIPMFEMKNIGIGTAKQIEFNWNYKSNIQKLCEYHYSINPQVDFKCSLNNHSIFLVIDGSPTQFGNWNDKISFPFLHNEEHNQSLLFPYVYQMIIKDIYSKHLTNEEISSIIPKIPNIEASISYSDIQGKHYYKKLNIICNTTLASVREDSSGYAIITLTVESIKI